MKRRRGNAAQRFQLNSCHSLATSVRWLQPISYVAAVAHCFLSSPISSRYVCWSPSSARSDHNGFDCVAFICYLRLDARFSLYYLSNFSSIILSHSCRILSRKLIHSEATLGRGGWAVNRSSGLREIYCWESDTDSFDPSDTFCCKRDMELVAIRPLHSSFVSFVSRA